ncbi:MAG TPA: hypothetical protein VFZ27_10165 [Terriglobia bacterium]|nr:hypothetical protein [Terriglobia bacterium]
MAVKSQPGAKSKEGSLGAGKLGARLPFLSAGKSGAHSPGGERSSRPPLGSSPILQSLLFLVVVTLLVSSFGRRDWSKSAAHVPMVRDVFALMRSHGSPLPQDDVKVWTKQQFGFYYCQGEVLFGRKPGTIMTQSEALGSGYRPVHEQYCVSSTPKEESIRGEPPVKPLHAS